MNRSMRKAINFARGTLAMPFLFLEWLCYRFADLCAATSEMILGE
jgi:hypothetical protein